MADSTVVCDKFIGRRSAVPVLYVKGTNYEVGFDVGRNFASIIKEFLSSYDNLRQFEKQYKTDTGKAVYDKTLANMKLRYPQYIKEIQGVADGADVPFYQLFLLQLDDIIETINDHRGLPRNDTGGCTSIAVKTPDNVLLGHTEDAFGETLNHFYIMSAHIIPEREDQDKGAVEERFSSLCYAGNMPGYTMGFNEHGLVFSINTLSPLMLKPGGTPRTFITRRLLGAKNFADSERILRDEGLGVANGFSINMIWTDSTGSSQIQNVEVAPDMKNDRSNLDFKKYEKEPLVHVNIYQHLNVSEVIGRIIDSSASRMQAIRRHPAPRTRADLLNILSDKTSNDTWVFQDTPGDVINTIAAGVFDVKERTWSIYIDTPNTSEPVAVLPIRFSFLEK